MTVKLSLRFNEFRLYPPPPPSPRPLLPLRCARRATARITSHGHGYLLPMDPPNGLNADEALVASETFSGNLSEKKATSAGPGPGTGCQG